MSMTFFSPTVLALSHQVRYALATAMRLSSEAFCPIYGLATPTRKHRAFREA